jgi:hypothetical protein
MALAACLMACLARPVRAGVTLPDQAMVEARTLVLNGMGLRKATWLRVKVHVAGLYLEEMSLDAARSLFANWLGARTSSPALKAGLLSLC